jgi:hypothetical protein
LRKKLIYVNVQIVARQTITSWVEKDIHRRLRVLLVQGRMAEKNFAQWLRAREAEAVKGKK